MPKQKASAMPATPPETWRQRPEPADPELAELAELEREVAHPEARYSGSESGGQGRGLGEPPHGN